LRRDWEVKPTHIYREGNLITDHLASRGHDLPLQSHDIDVSLPCI
ncbi:hypothetical protein LINGRAHAP2_LOCUS36320, partial [Linum grandiflorum]